MLVFCNNLSTLVNNTPKLHNNNFIKATPISTISNYLTSYQQGLLKCPPFNFTPLGNSQNECFVNSSIYSLFSNKPFLDLLYGLSLHIECSQLPILSLLSSALTTLLTKNSNYSNGSSTQWMSSESKNMLIESVLECRPGGQHDVGEFIHKLLSKMDQEVVGIVGSPQTADDGWSVATKKKGIKIRNSGNSKSIISQLFGCSLALSVRKYNDLRSLEVQKSFILQLPIKKSGRISLERALTEFLAVESAGGKGNAQFCSSMHSISRTLVIQLMIVDYSAGEAVKSGRGVDFPKEMSLDGSMFRLCAVQCHRGRSASHGHYVTVVAVEGEWTMCTDLAVRGGVDVHSPDNGTPYLFHYCRV